MVSKSLRTTDLSCTIPKAQRRSSLALGSVVRIFSSRRSDVIRLRISAQRWLELRLSFRPDFRWRIVLSRLLVMGAFARLDFLSGRKMLYFHAEFRPISRRISL